jgi:hypothetical protein
MADAVYNVLELNSCDNEYLHKDFHGALCYAIKYLDEKYGDRAVADYLGQVGREVFSPLIAALKQEGLIALERHFKAIFEKEGGRAEFKCVNDVLVITVFKCPAITHLTSTGQLVTDRYCETTVNVNKAVCDAAGYQCSCEYTPAAGRCVQKFWKQKGASK